MHRKQRMTDLASIKYALLSADRRIKADPLYKDSPGAGYSLALAAVDRLLAFEEETKREADRSLAAFLNNPDGPGVA
jgi:hypothetical protein